MDKNSFGNVLFFSGIGVIFDSNIVIDNDYFYMNVFYISYIFGYFKV